MREIGEHRGPCGQVLSARPAATRLVGMRRHWHDCHRCEPQAAWHTPVSRPLHAGIIRVAPFDFSPEGLDEMLVLNARVHYGEDAALRHEFASAIEANIHKSITTSNP